MAKLTKRTVEAAQPDPTRDVFVWDAELRGFGVRIKPSGMRSYVVQYRNVLGRSRRVNLGRHGVLTADEARRLARAHLGSVARGDDPAQERRDKRESLTVSELVARYKTDHAPKNKPITRTENFRLIDKHILPALGALAIAEVTTAHVARLHASMASAPYSANRVLYLVAILFNLAEKWRLLPRGSNPARDVEEYRETARERYLSELEIRRLGKALAAAEADEPEKVAAVKLLLLTGCRRGEIFSLRWQDIDRERRLLLLADSKTGPRPVMLSTSALAVIDRIPERHDVWVFPNPTKDGPIREMRKFWGAVLKAASITNLRLHDLRHSFASDGVTQGIPLYTVGKLLGHRQASTSQRYAHLADDPLRAASERIGAHLVAAMGSGPSDLKNAGGIRRARSGERRDSSPNTGVESSPKLPEHEVLENSTSPLVSLGR